MDCQILIFKVFKTKELVALYGLAFGINYLQLTRLAKSRFQRTYVNRLLAALGCLADATSI